MEIERIIDGMTPEVYQRLATAVELGKWPDGVALTPEQKETMPGQGEPTPTAPEVPAGRHAAEPILIRVHADPA